MATSIVAVTQRRSVTRSKCSDLVRQDTLARGAPLGDPNLPRFGRNHCVPAAVMNVFADLVARGEQVGFEMQVRSPESQPRWARFEPSATSTPGSRRGAIRPIRETSHRP